MRVSNRLILLLVLATSSISCLAKTSETTSPEIPMESKDPASILLAVDQAFSDRAQETDIPTAFLEYAAGDAVMYRNGMEPLVGKEAIARVLAGEAGATLVWKPLRADIAESGELGYTRGSFTYHTAPGEDGAPAQGPFKGHYVSIWKRQADGSWKWVFDSGIISKVP